MIPWPPNLHSILHLAAGPQTMTSGVVLEWRELPDLPANRNQNTIHHTVSYYNWENEITKNLSTALFLHLWVNHVWKTNYTDTGRRRTRTKALSEPTGVMMDSMEKASSSTRTHIHTKSTVAQLATSIPDGRESDTLQNMTTFHLDLTLTPRTHHCIYLLWNVPLFPADGPI
jgi:hypothetical protein